MKMNIALVAHDEMKNTMVGFCIAYEEILKKYVQAKRMSASFLKICRSSFRIRRMKSGRRFYVNIFRGKNLKMFEEV